ncbi:MAG TPA: AIR synthase-related protein, partial [Chitinophagaceae bacterium]|nr:AIR synthase-related protein [Chitinophagaceae bacterium]
AARNIVCSGGKPLGVTNCLNFGNPFDPEVYYQFVQAVKGMGEACIKFETPVTGGNVSFYNQNPDGPVYPTPTIGMVGLVEDLAKKMTLNFKNEGDLIYLLGKNTNDINCSEYLHKIIGQQFSPAPYFELEEEFNLQKKLSSLIDKQLIQSAHDISEGGLFITLCESCFTSSFGFEIAADSSLKKDAYLFGEGQGRVVVSVKEKDRELLESEIKNMTYSMIGKVTKNNIWIDGEDWGRIEVWNELYDSAIEKIMSSTVANEMPATL